MPITLLIEFNMQKETSDATGLVHVLCLYVGKPPQACNSLQIKTLIKDTIFLHETWSTQSNKLTKGNSLKKRKRAYSLRTKL